VVVGRGEGLVFVFGGADLCGEIGEPVPDALAELPAGLGVEGVVFVVCAGCWVRWVWPATWSLLRTVV
jgi:hypothetical protein